ncbi:MAG TPA: hypothetical protein VNI20_06190 [Fimbriimonadaceae bacterium]|nr:hypothetical protein [Fimbriimonadaceae bacterium]
MNKKKNNVLIATVVSILVLGVVGLNLSQYFRFDGSFQQIDRPNAEALKKLKERQVHNVPVTGSSMPALSHMMKIGDDNKVGTQVETVPEVPSILIPSIKHNTPQHDPNRSSPGWYNPNSSRSQEAADTSKYKEDK